MKRLIIICTVVALICAAGAAQDAIMVHPCDSLDTAEIATGGGLPESTLKVATDAANVTEGEGSLHISAKSTEEDTGNTYLAIDVGIEPTSFADHKLLFDTWTSTPEQSRALYVRGYDAEGNCVLSWMSWSGPLTSEPKTFELIPEWSKDLAWEQKMVDVEPETPVTRLRFYVGTGEDGVAFDMYVDNIRTVEYEMMTFEDVDEVKTLFPNTTIVEDGEPQCIIVTPTDEGWGDVAQDIATAIEEATGARLSIQTGDEVDTEQLRETNAIIIGSIVNNRALLYPYSHNLTFADGIYPGDGGYEVRSVHDPWGTGKNILAIGASDLSGAQAGAEFFRGLITEGDSLVLEPFSKTELADTAARYFSGAFRTDPDDQWLRDRKEEAEDRLQSGIHGGLFSLANQVGRNYALSRKPGYARQFAWLIKRAHEHYLTDPQTYGGPWGMDSDFRIYTVIPAWDAVEECPALTPEDRLQVTKILHKWVSEVGPGKTASASSTRVRFNHQTFPGLGLLYAGQYFSRYYDTVEGEHWIDLADGCFQFQMQAMKAHCDCNGYQWLTDSHTINYALARPDFTIFENDNARFLADYAIATMNNLGYQVPYGDMHGWGTLGAEMRVLQPGEWYYRDGRYQWALDKKHEIGGRHSLGTFAVDSPDTTVPDDLSGALVWPLGDDWYRSFAGKEHVAREKAYDKIIFRNGFAPSDQYMLIDGLSRGGHGHYDGNSILQWTGDERIWLGEPETTRFSSAPKLHNTVLVLRDGRSETFPAYSSLENFVDLPDFAACRTRVSDYAGTDWDRWILWLRDDAFVVIDRVEAKEAGDYSARALWHTVGDVTLHGTALDIQQDGKHARIAMSSETRCLLSHDQDNHTWSSYPHIEDPTTHLLQGVVNGQLNAGERLSLFTILHSSGEEPSGVQIQALGENMAVVKGLGDPMLIMLPGPEGNVSVPAAASASADLLVLTPEKAYGANVREMAFDGQQQTFTSGADMQVNIGSGQATVQQPARTSTEAEQAVRIANIGARATPGDLRGLINQTIAMTPSATEGAQAGVEAPELVARWKYADVPDELLLTANTGMFGAVDPGLQISAEPEPLEANVFSQVPGGNAIDAINDGTAESTSDSVMWDDDEQVTVTLSFDRECSIEEILLKAWFATASSKDKLFQLGHLKVVASNDGFAGDVRTIVDFEDRQMHGNWGTPGHAPHDYRFEDLDTTASALRFVLTPRPETAIYIAELMVWGDAEGLTVMPTGGRAVETFRSIHAADLNGDGTDEIIAGARSGTVFCLDSQGQPKWTFDAHASVESVNTADLNGDGTPSVIAGGEQATMYALTPSGEKIWEYVLPHYKRTPNIRTVFPADLNGDGSEAAIAGADSWRYYAFDGEGNKLWQYESVHGATEGTAADMDGDGDEEVLATTEYYAWHCIDADGSGIWRYHSGRAGGPRCNDVTAADIDGDGTPEAVFAGADANIHVVADGNLEWTLNTGDEVTGVACADATGDGVPEIFAGSLSFNTYCVDGQGETVWRTDVMTPVVALTLVGDYVAIGCSDGAVYLLNPASGEIAGRFETGLSIIALGAADMDGEPVLLASSEDGYLYAITLPEG